MPDEFDDYVVTEPTRTRRGALKFQPDNSDWTLDLLPELQDYYSTTYGRKLPVTVAGQGSIHRKWGLDHRASADISLNPATDEGKALITELQRRNIPFLAFDKAIPGSSTGPHIHLGRPSHRGNGNFPVGSQVKGKRGAQPTPTPDDFDKYVTGRDDSYTTGDRSAPVRRTAPATPNTTQTPRTIEEALANVTASANQVTPTVLRKHGLRSTFGMTNIPTADIAAGVRTDDRNQLAAIQAGVDRFEGVPETIDAGNSQPMDLLNRTKANIRAERGFKSSIGMPQTLNPVTAVRNYFGYKDEEAQVDAEARQRIDQGFVESERLREITDQFTDSDRQQLANVYNTLAGGGPLTRGVGTGTWKVGSSLLTKLAALADLSMQQPFESRHETPLGNYLRRKAAVGEVAVSEIEADLPPDMRQQLSDFTSHAVLSLPEMAGAVALGGPIGGFAALGGLEAYGQKRSLMEVARETAKGAVIGGVFQGAALAEGGGKSFAQRAADTARSGAVIGVGTYGVEKAFGADDASALKAAASNVVFHTGMRVPGLVGELSQMAEKAYKTPKEEIATVPEDLQTRLSQAEALSPPSTPLDTQPAGIVPRPQTPTTPAVDAVSAVPTAPALERRGPERMPDADWLELTDAERAQVRREVDAEQDAAVDQPPAVPKTSLADAMRARAESGPEPPANVEITGSGRNWTARFDTPSGTVVTEGFKSQADAQRYVDQYGQTTPKPPANTQQESSSKARPLLYELLTTRYGRPERITVTTRLGEDGLHYTDKVTFTDRETGQSRVVSADQLTKAGAKFPKRGFQTANQAQRFVLDGLRKKHGGDINTPSDWHTSRLPDGRWEALLGNRHLGIFDDVTQAREAVEAAKGSIDLGDIGTSRTPEKPIGVQAADQFAADRMAEAEYETARRASEAKPSNSDIIDLTDQDVDAGPINLLTGKPIKRKPGEEGGFNLRALFGKKKTPDELRAEMDREEAEGHAAIQAEMAAELKAPHFRPSTVSEAGDRYGKLNFRMLYLNNRISDAGRLNLTKAEVDRLWLQHKVTMREVTALEEYIADRGYKVNPLGEVARPGEPFPGKKWGGEGERGAIDLTEVLAGLDELRRKFPGKTERELRAMLPVQHREVLERGQPLHPANEQPRADTGEFAPGAPGGPEAAKSQLRSEARKYASDFKALDLHQARRLGLDVANDDIARNYFTKLHRMAAEYTPELASAVDRAETLYNQGKYSQATMLAESVFSKLPDKVNEYSSAIAAMQLQEMGLEAKTNWRKVLQEVRTRLQRTGGLSGGGSTFYDVNKRPEGGRPDHEKIAYILEPVIEALKADARRLMAEGKLRIEGYVEHVRKAVTDMLAREEFGDWHPLNKSAAFGVLVDRLRKEGVPPPPVEPPTTEAAPEQRRRSLPKTLEASGRDPGTNLTYDRLPNAQVNQRVEARLANEGADALETWYRNAPESADRTAAHRVLVDHYTAEAVKLADTAPKAAEAAMQRARDLSNLESERATTLGQTIQQYSQLLKYSPAGVMSELSRMEAEGVKVPDAARQQVVKTAQEHQRLDGEVRRLERDLVEAEGVEAGGPQGATAGGGGGKGGGKGGRGAASGGEEGAPKPRRYRPRSDTVLDSEAERIRRKLDEAAKRRRAAKAAIAAQLKQLEQSRTVAGYWKRSMNITRGLMVSAFSTAMRNLQSQALRFDTERLTDTVEHTMRRAVGLDSDLTYRNIWRNANRKFKTGSPLDIKNLVRSNTGQAGEAKDILMGHPGEYHRMFNNYAGGVEVPIPGAIRGRVERVFQTVERGVEIANVFNRLQEFHLRSAEFLAELDLHLRKEHNQTLEQFVSRNGVDAIPLDLIRKGVDKALEVTFADVPGRDGAGGRFLNSMIEVGNYIPPTLSPVAFPRFMFNNLKFLYQHSPVGMLDLARKNQNRPRVIARSLVGTSMLLLAYQFRNSDHAGEKWYELKVGGHTLDARPFGPFSTYLFMAEAIRRQLNGEKAFTPEEIAGAIGASTGPGGTAISVAQKLYDYAAAGKWDKWQRVLKTEAGDWGRALLTPIRQVKDLIGAFDTSQAINRDTNESPLIGPVLESIPYAGEAYGLPAAQLPTTATPIHQEHPAVKAITGWRVETPKTFLQRELDTLNFTSTEVRPSTGIPALDALEKRLMGPLMDQLSAELEKDTEYRKLSKKERAVYLKDFITDIREQVREMGEAEHPELYEQLKEERKPRRQRELEQEQSPGLSKALQLGVPMPIPPMRPGEDDIAYRARLLQLGRQRRARMDSVVDPSLPRAAQQRALHQSLYV